MSEFFGDDILEDNHDIINNQENINYVFEFMNITNIYKFITPNNYELEKNNYFKLISLFLNNPNCVILIIENMSLGIILTKDFAYNFEYIRKLKQYNKGMYLEKNLSDTNFSNKYKFTRNFKIKIVTIDINWDTYKLSTLKIDRLYDWIQFIQNKSINYLKIMTNSNESLKYNKIDFNFLEMLSWNPIFLDKKDNDIKS